MRTAVITGGAAGLGVLERFEDQDAGTFTDHEAVTLFVERTACRCRIVIAE